MHPHRLSNLHTAAYAIGAVACLVILGCGDGQLADAVAAGHLQQAPSQPVLAEPAPAPARAAATAAREPAARPSGSAALHDYRQDVDVSHAAIASYFD
ncbi:MAG TPA: hypothetical protein VF169_05550 [Albitalea sp.]|uniref:hypothetical protein n=1 Tax=Piscinibacter sp. TaxID=1903157 RepID=UPI002ED0A5F6